MALVRSNADGARIDGEAVTKQLVNMAMLLQSALPALPPVLVVAVAPGIASLSTHTNTVAGPLAVTAAVPIRSPSVLPQRSNAGSLLALSAQAHSAPAPPAPAPQPEPKGIVDMQVVGQCPGDKTKHDDLAAVEQRIATPVPPEQEGDDLASDTKGRNDQDIHTESRFREELAKRRPTDRSQPAVA